MSDLMSAVASLVSQHMQVYSKRQATMRATRNMEYTKFKSGELHKRQVQEWFKVAGEDCIDFDHDNRGILYLRGASFASGSTTSWYKSEKAKKNAVAGHFAHEAWLDRNGYFHSVEQQAAALAEIQATLVHPFAKQICKFMKLRKATRLLTEKQSSLHEALRQLNKLKLGFKVNFGNRDGYASDRIASVTVGERTFKPKEFVQEIEFESKVLSGS
jgi:hypothetical protein